jgi:ABC-type transport system substrate-binding protein
VTRTPSRSRWRWLTVLVVGLACRPTDSAPRYRPAGSAQPRAGGTLRFSVTSGVATLDPTIANDELAYLVMHPMFDTLVDFAPAGLDLVPRLAERWTISPDGLVYTFTLRAGIAFSDGAPITAAHVKFSLERALTVAGSPFAQYLRGIVGAPAVIDQAAIDQAVTTCSGITALDDRRLELRLAEPNAAMLAILAMPFATPQRPESIARAGSRLRSAPDATGPFMLARWDEGDRIELRRNPHYHDPKRAHLDAIVMLENVPRATQAQLFERGELESVTQFGPFDSWFGAAAADWAPYRQRAPGMNVFGSRMDVSTPPFSDVRVRRALNHALDKAHTARLLYGTTTPSHGALPPGMLGYDPALGPYPHDVDLARRLLAEAGYPHGLDLEYLTYSDSEAERVAASLQSDLAEAGVRIRITVRSMATYQALIARPGGSAFSYISWGADFPDPINFLDAKFHSRAGRRTNDSAYANPELDAVLDAARRELDVGQRAALYRRAERILYDDAPWIWDYHRLNTEVIQPYVRGHTLHPIWLRDFTSAWLDVGADGRPVPR